MSYNGSGTFNINSAGQPVVSGTVITSTAFNALTSDLATGLSTALTKDGQTTPTANLPMGGKKITGLGAGTAAADAVRFDQLTAAGVPLITVAGTADAITGTITPSLTAYTTGGLFSFVVGSTNTTAVTLNIDGLGAKAVTRTGSVALVAGDMVTGQVVLVEYDGTRFQLLNGNSFTNLKASGTLGVTGLTTLGVTGAVFPGSSSGTATIVAPAAAGTPTLTLPTNTGTFITDFSTPAYRNRIINGDQRIDQVNAGAAQTYTAAAAVAYNVDMFYGSCTGANVTGQRVAGTSPNQYAYKYTGAASVTQILHGTRIESFDVSDLVSQTATLSVKLSNSLLTSVTWTAYYANVADTFSAKTQIATGTFTITSTPTVYSAQISMGANAANGVSIEFTVGAQTSGTWLIENVQLEKGSSATAFDFRDYESELARCQRYLPCVRCTGSGAIETLGMSMVLSGAASVLAVVPFSVPARAKVSGCTLSAAADFVTVNNANSFITALTVTYNQGGSTSALIIISPSVGTYTAGFASPFGFATGATSASYIYFTGARL